MHHCIGRIVMVLALCCAKDVDRFRGKPAEDTGITSVFVGPRVVASRGRWSAEFDVDLPVSIENTALQVIPDYRLRGGVSFHF